MKLITNNEATNNNNNMTMNLLKTYILEKKIDDLKYYMSINHNIDLNKQMDGFTPLMLAIAGGMNRNNYVGNGSLEIVKFLLENNADPNKCGLYVTPIYRAVIEERADIIALLIAYGGDPNKYSFVRKISDNSYTSRGICKLPIIRAIDNFSVECAKALIYNDAKFTKTTINYAKTKLEKYEDKSIHDDKNYSNIIKINIKNLKKIIKLLEKNHHDNMELFALEYVEQNQYTEAVQNEFIGFF